VAVTNAARTRRAFLVAAVLASTAIGPTIAQAAGALAISPPSGRYAMAQRFDLVLVIVAPGLTVVATDATLDGANVSAALTACLPGTALAGGQTVRCPGLTGSVIGPGLHTLSVSLIFDDGSSVTEEVLWEVLGSAGP
jgi:hypothetical protein